MPQTSSYSTSTTPLAPEMDILSVSRLNATVRLILEEGLPDPVWVEGEISNLSRPSSGHWYFSLKDAMAQVRCAMFRQANAKLRFTLEQGARVIVRARVSVYEARGDYQLIADYMEPAGDGELQRAFEALKQKLFAEGLFDEARKKPLPKFAGCIGIVTSPTGAAIRDILSVVRRRFPALPVIVYPVAVQGENAAPQIEKALQTAARRDECDVLIVARGGGSLEDLWAFNEERVARAIAACPIPIVSGVGHEIDFTIADFVADYRAPTPTAAAELLTPDQQQLIESLRATQSRLANLMGKTLVNRRQKLMWLEKRLEQQHPAQRLNQRRQRLDEMELRLVRAQRALLRHRQASSENLLMQLYRHSPRQTVQRYSDRHTQLSQRLTLAMQNNLDRLRQRLASTSRALDTVSPLATLSRGYAIVSRADNGHIVTNANTVDHGTRIVARLHEGSLLCTVDSAQGALGEK